MPEGKALYRKWRPQKFADLVGQEHIKQTIINAIVSERVAHAYLFAGPRGTGKTSLARLLAKAVNCTDNKSGEPCDKCRNCLAFVQGSFVDLIEIDAASHTGVDDVRDLIEKVSLVPSLGKYKVYIIDEVHMLSKPAFNALLKTLEEPPAHAIFVLATTEVHKLLPTVVSRCQYFDFHYLSIAEVIEQLKKVAAAEQISIADDALQLIAENSEGSLRDALSMLDQASGSGEVKIERAELAKLLGVVDSSIIQQLTRAVIDNQAVVGINLINEVYFKGYDLNQLAKQWMNYLRELLMVKLGNGSLLDRSADDKKLMTEQINGISANQLINWLQRLVESTNTYKLAQLPQLALEMAVLKCVTTSAEPVVNKPIAPSKPEPMVDKIVTPPIVTLPTNPSKVDVATLWPQLCAKLELTNPAIGALLKSSSAVIDGDKLVIELPSDFLKNVMSKASNHQMILTILSELGISNLPVEYRVVKQSTGVVADVAGVFDIM